MNNEVVIIGGGPAGAATALQLAARGIQSVILEARPATIMKPGETLPPQARKIFRQLNLLHVLDHPAHLSCYGNRSLWGRATATDTPFYHYTQPEGWHINRLVFESQLQEEVISRGIQLHDGCRVLAIDPSGDGWNVTCTDTNQHTRTIECSFIVDATGRQSRIARNIGIERRNLDRLVGCYSILPYTGTIMHYTHVESVENGWWYLAPLTAQQVVLTYMTDADLLLPTQRSAAGFTELLAQTAYIKKLVPGEMPEPKIHTAATGYLKQRYGHNWLAVGDAAFAYDPVSSHGIISAMESGYFAAHAIADHLSNKPDALLAYDYAISQAFSVYMKMHADHYTTEDRWINSPFWRRRGRLDV